MLGLPLPQINTHVYAHARTHVRKGCVDAICNGTRTSLAGKNPNLAHKLPLARE